MALPASGPISMSMINTELGRASNTTNTSLAGGSTPAVGSLFSLGDVSGSINQTAPHQMSEWYNYAATPIPIRQRYTRTGATPPVVAYAFRSGSTSIINTSTSTTDNRTIYESTVPLTASVTIAVAGASVNLQLIVKNITAGTTLSTQGPNSFSTVGAGYTYQWTGNANTTYEITASAIN
jgi:hypothetical protein